MDRLRQSGNILFPGVEDWQADNQGFLKCSEMLIAAVHDREPEASSQYLAQLQQRLGQKARETLAVLSQIEPLTGDLTVAVAAALRRNRSQHD